MKWYIYEEAMYGDDYRCTETNSFDCFKPFITEAETKEEAKSNFLKAWGMAEDDEDAWRYYAVSVKSTMRFKCEDCGKHFGYPKIVKESRGEYWGIPCQEDVSVCPHCGSVFFYEVEEEVAG